MQTITIELGTVDDKGTIAVYQPFKDIIRALLLKWIQEGESGERAAKAMMIGKMKDVMAGQLQYWRNGISFLSQRFAREMGQQLNLKNQLAIVAGWGEDSPLPESWMPHIEHAEMMGDTHEPEEPTPVGSGDVRQQPLGEPAGKGRRGKGSADGRGDATDSRQVRRKGANANAGGKGGDAADHHGSGSSPTTGGTARQPRGAKRPATDQAGGGRTATRNRKPRG